MPAYVDKVAFLSSVVQEENVLVGARHYPLLITCYTTLCQRRQLFKTLLNSVNTFFKSYGNFSAYAFHDRAAQQVL